MCSLVVVSIKGTIRLDKPIKLGFTGFSAPLPSGENWDTKTSEWVFDENNNYFYLGAIEKQRGVTSTVARWRYIVCPEDGSIDEIFQNRGADMGGYGGEKKAYIGNGFGAYLANFRHNAEEYVYLALIILEPGRMAELEVRGKDQFFSGDVFKSLLTAAKFENNGFISGGRLLTDNARSKMAAERREENQFENLYLLDSHGVVEGFTGLRRMPSKNNYAVKGIMYARDGVYDLHRQNLFSLTPDGRITWKFEQQGFQPSAKREVLLELAADRELTITDFTKRTTKNIRISDFSWYEIIDYELLGAFIEFMPQEAVVDFLSPQGVIMPTLLQKRQKNNHWVVMLSYLNMPDTKIEIGVEGSGMVFERTINSNQRHKIKRCAKEDILARFPQQSGFLQRLFD